MRRTPMPPRATGLARSAWLRGPAKPQSAICPNAWCRLFLPTDVEDVDADLVCRCGSDWATEIPSPRRVRSTVKRSSGLAQRGSRVGAASGLPKPPADFSAATRRIVAARSGGICELRGCGADATDMHHRQKRRLGNHTAVNALHCCARHHVPAVHGNPAWSIERGYIVETTEDPAAVAMLTDHGWVLLTADGRYEPAEGAA